MFEGLFRRYFNSKYIIFSVVMVLLLFFIFYCKDIAIMFFACFVIACSLNPIVDELSKKLPRGIATDIVTAVLLIIILAVCVPICILSFD